MLPLEDIEDALIAHILANVECVKTCETHEKELDDTTLSVMMPRTPFILIRYGGTDPDESQRMATGGSGIKKREFYLSLGALSLRTKKDSQRGAYDLLDQLRKETDSITIMVNDEPVTFSYEGDRLVFSSAGGAVIYSLILSWMED